MIRVTNNMVHNDLVRTLNRQKNDMQKIENDLATGQRIRRPSDDPAGSANQMILRSRMTELSQYDKNVTDARDRLNIIDGKLNSVGDILQRIRVLTIQAANGINTDFERSEAIGREIDQHLLALIDIANTQDATGEPLFGGSVIERDAFQVVYGNEVVDGMDRGRAVTGVLYQGDIVTLKREIERGEQMDVTLAGNRVFWGTNQTIATNRDASTYLSMGDQSFSIDGVKIRVNAGDNLEDIVEKINNAPLEVTASIGAGNDLVLSSETPHEMWFEDLEGGTVLQDLGVLDGRNPGPGNNLNPEAVVTGQSIFDVVIQLRNDLVNGEIINIGGRDLEAIDMAMQNVLRYRSEAGARVNRIESHERRIAWDQTYTQDLLAKNESVDTVETIVNLKWLESVHNYALRVGAGLIKPTLMDFLR